MKLSVIVLMTMISSASAFAYVNTPPVQIRGQKNVILEGIHVENPNGDCISVWGSTNVIIRNSDIGPCKGGTGRGIHSSGSSKVEITNNVIHDIERQGVSIEKDTDDFVHHNNIQRTSTAVYTAAGNHLNISYNYIDTINGNVDGKGHAVIFNQVNGGGGRINCNKIYNDNSTPIRLEDIIDIYASSGLPNDPIQVSGNRMYGGAGGINWNGGGIIIADGPGVTEYVVANDNLVINTGSYGMEVMTGSNISITNNFIMSDPFGGNNNGIYASNYYHDACVKNPSVISVGKLYACDCNPVTITGNTIQYQHDGGGFGNVNANGTCGSTNGPITNSTLAATNNLASRAEEYPFPSFETVRPSCDGEAGVISADQDLDMKSPPPAPTLDPNRSVPDQCGEWLEKYNIVPYVAWGRSPAAIQIIWDKQACNHEVCFYFKDKYGATSSTSFGTLPSKFRTIWNNPLMNCSKVVLPSPAPTPTSTPTSTPTPTPTPTSTPTQSVPNQCGEWLEKYNLIPYVSWGSTPETIRPTWDKQDCNHQVCFYFKDKYGATSSSSFGSLSKGFQGIWDNPRVNCNKVVLP